MTRRLRPGRLRAWAWAALAAALLLAQHTAWRHRLGHDLAPLGSFASVVFAPPAAGGDDDPGHASACHLCLAQAALAWAAPADQAHAEPVDTAEPSPQAPAVCATEQPRHRAAPIRGPPAAA